MCSFSFRITAAVVLQLTLAHDAAMHAGKGASSGVGFAIPIDTAKGLVEQVLKYGKVVRPVLGITIAPPQTVRQIGVEGVLVLEVPSGGPADRAGIKGTYRWAARPPPYTLYTATNFSEFVIIQMVTVRWIACQGAGLAQHLKAQDTKERHALG